MIPLADTHDCTGIQYPDPCCWSLFGSSRYQDPLQTHGRSAHRHGGHRGFEMGTTLDTEEEVPEAHQESGAPGNIRGTERLIWPENGRCQGGHAKRPHIPL